MNKFICLDCGHIFGEDDVVTWMEDRGEYWGSQCYEEVSGCPHCRGSYVKAYKCDCCDEWIDGTYIKLESGERICDDCYTTYDLGDEE